MQKKDITLVFSDPCSPARVTFENPQQSLTRIMSEWGYDIYRYMACQLTHDGLVLLPLVEPDPRDCGNSDYKVEIKFSSVNSRPKLPKPDVCMVSTSALPKK